MLQPHQLTDRLWGYFDATQQPTMLNVAGESAVDGYMVAGEVEPFFCRPTEVDTYYLATDHYLAKHWSLLQRPDHYAMISSEEGVVYVDIVRNVADLYTALAIADARMEESVWDVAHGTEVFTEWSAQ